MKIISILTIAALAWSGSGSRAIAAIPVASKPVPTVSAVKVAAAMPGNLTPSNFQQDILNLVNAERKKAGLQPLKLNSQLAQAAQNHTNDMVSKGYFSHTSPSGGKMVMRVKATGYAYTSIGENIAAGNATAAGTMTQWMNSSGHRANILNPKFKELGVGYAPSQDQYKHYWTQVFGAAR